MTELTAEKIRLVTLAVAALRLTGKINPGEEVSQREFERISHQLGCPVSARHFRRIEHQAISKARLAALALQAIHSPTETEKP